MATEPIELFTLVCTDCGSDVRGVAEQRGEFGSIERHTARYVLACGCTVCSDMPQRHEDLPPDWTQDMDYEHPVSAGEKPASNSPSRQESAGGSDE